MLQDFVLAEIDYCLHKENTIRHLKVMNNVLKSYLTNRNLINFVLKSISFVTES